MPILDDIAKRLSEAKQQLAEADRAIKVLEGAGEDAASQRAAYNDQKKRLDKLEASLATVKKGA